MKKLIIALLSLCCMLMAAKTTLAAGPYVDNGDATVLGESTGLMWQQADDGVLRYWEDACRYCEDLELAGHDDWRIPEVEELSSIVDYTDYSPSISTEVFSSKPSGYWSGSTSSGYTDYAWSVDFYNGYVGAYDKTNYDFYVRCVRAGPYRSFDPLNPLIISLLANEASVYSNSDIAFRALVGWGKPEYSYAWDFQDGATSDTRDLSHAFEQYGIYDVELIVTDTDGHVSTETRKITVMPPPAAVTIYADKTEAASPVDVAFSTTLTDTTYPYTWLYDFGDGSIANDEASIHTYTDAGTFTASVTVTDAFGGKSNTSTIVIEVKLELAKNGTATVNFSDGNGYYQARSSDTSIAKTALAGNSVEITGVSEGEAWITITDTEKFSRTIPVLVGAGLSADAAGLSITKGENNENNTFMVSGGTPPYNVKSENEAIAAAELNDSTVGITAHDVGSTTITVTDAAHDTVEVIVRVTHPVTRKKAIMEVVILDTCYSGSFLQGLSPVSPSSGRVVITSADDHTVAWNVEGMNFSMEFINRIRRGSSLLDAFRGAEDTIINYPNIFGDFSCHPVSGVSFTKPSPPKVIAPP